MKAPEFYGLWLGDVGDGVVPMNDAKINAMAHASLSQIATVVSHPFSTGPATIGVNPAGWTGPKVRYLLNNLLTLPRES